MLDSEYLAKIHKRLEILCAYGRGKMIIYVDKKQIDGFETIESDKRIDRFKKTFDKEKE